MTFSYKYSQPPSEMHRNSLWQVTEIMFLFFLLLLSHSMNINMRHSSLLVKSILMLVCTRFFILIYSYCIVRWWIFELNRVVLWKLRPSQNVLLCSFCNFSSSLCVVCLHRLVLYACKKNRMIAYGIVTTIYLVEWMKEKKR